MEKSPASLWNSHDRDKDCLSVRSRYATPNSGMDCVLTRTERLARYSNETD